ncbi:MAG: hypothetical protein E7264_06965 [Lachnospiraceae bacterium]|nr:hypothetical protein [Lachnospiraceae bacterium]
MIDAKELLQLETAKRKKEFFDNMSYVAYYIFWFVLFGYSMLIGAEQNLSRVVMGGYVYLFSLLMYLYIQPLMFIKEQGVWRNVFHKYRDIPVSMQQLYCTKMRIACKQIVKLSLIYQVFALIGRWMEGFRLVNISMLLFPIIYGLVMILVFGIWMYVCKRRAEV